MGEPTAVRPRGDFGTYLRQVREERRLSLDAVEEMTSSYPGRVTKSHLSRIENGQAEPTFPRMFTLSQVYGVPIASMAERFESDLRRLLVDHDLEALPAGRLLREARALHDAGRHAEALQRLELLLERDQAVPDRVRLRLQRIACLVGLSRFALAREECEELLALPDLSTDDRVAALQGMARCCHRLGRLPLARIVLEQAERLADELPKDDPKRAHLPMASGAVHHSSGRYAEALADYRRALERFEALGLGFDAALARLSCGVALIDCGKPVEAHRQIRRALRQARAEGHEHVIAGALHALGRLAFRQGNLAAAETCCLQSNRIARARNDATLVFCNSYYLWHVARERNDTAGTAMYERALRRHVGRMPAHLPEARRFRASEAMRGT